MARREGLGAPIAGGPHVLAFLQEALMEALGPEVLLHGAHFDVRWVSPVRSERSIASRATVSRVEADRILLELAVDCEGERALVGSAALPLDPEPGRASDPS
jgi:acyl dehydratase